MGCDARLKEVEDRIFTPSGMSETKAERLARIRSANVLLKALADEQPENDACLALLGISYYFLLGEDVDVSRREVVDALSAALRINPDNLFGSMYLAFQRFDDAEYAEAIDLISRVVHNRDYACVEVWQRMKIEEIELSCRIFLDPDKVPASEIVGLAEKLLRVEECDRAPLLELLKALRIHGL